MIKYGWKIARVKYAGSLKQGRGLPVILEAEDPADRSLHGVSFKSPVFAAAEVGEVWAVKLERDPPSILGKIEEALRLEGAASK
jgi:hypothetical protein